MARQLIRWHSEKGRAFPWRAEREPYRLVVAEILLRKTRAEAIVAAYEDLLATYPNAKALAVADEASIRGQIGYLGLGSQRSRQLRDAAKTLVAAESAPSYAVLHHPGIGDYGNAAIAVMAEDTVAAPVDGNIARIVMRVFGFEPIRWEPRKSPWIRERVRELFEDVSPKQRRSLLFGLLDLGALVCTPRRPRCSECPLTRSCSCRPLFSTEKSP